MINTDELLFVVDENNVPIEPMQRHVVHQNGYWHRTSHIWIVNSHKQILCQKRSLLKDSNPGKWEPFFGGHMAPSEEYRDNALNELEEELGIQADPASLHDFTIYRSEKGHEFQGVHYLIWDGSSESLCLEKDEVDEVRWTPLADVYAQVVTHKASDWSVMGYEDKLLDFIQTNQIHI